MDEASRLRRGVDLRHDQRLQFRFQAAFLVLVVLVGVEAVHIGTSQAAQPLVDPCAFVLDPGRFVPCTDPREDLLQPVGTAFDRADDAADLLVGYVAGI